MMPYTEDTLVQQTTAGYLEQKLGWQSVYAYNNEDFGPHSLLGRASDRGVALTRPLRRKLTELNPGLPPEAYDDAVRQIAATTATQSLLATNREKYNLIRDGVQVAFRNGKGERVKERLRVVDFANPEKNDFLCVRELWVRGDLYRRRADIVGFVNGLAAAKEAANENDETRKRFEVMCRAVFSKFKSCLTVSGVNDYRRDYEAVNAVYKSLQQDREQADISDIIRQLHQVVDEVIETRGSGVAEERDPYDISRIDFDRLRQEFERSPAKRTTVQNLKTAIETRLQRLLEKNPLRADYQRYYEQIVTEYNREKDRVTIEQTFAALLRFIDEMTEEEKRAVSSTTVAFLSNRSNGVKQARYAVVAVPGEDMPLFHRYIGIDYSGAGTSISSLKGLRVYSSLGVHGTNEHQW
jgi:type I site-specific restriction-modification system R (restriction) subunit